MHITWKALGPLEVCAIESSFSSDFRWSELYHSLTFYLMVAFSMIYFPIDSRRCLLLAQARPIVFYWFYKVFLSTVFSLVVVPSQKRSRTVHPRGEAGFPLVLQWLPCWAARSWRREAAVGQFHRMQGYVRNAWFPKGLQGFPAKVCTQTPQKRRASRAKTLIFLRIFNDLRKKGVPKTSKPLVLSCVSQKDFSFHHQSTRPGSLKDCLAFSAIKSDEISDFRPNNSFESIKFLGDVKNPLP